jgi:exonuclease SbcD
LRFIHAADLHIGSTRSLPGFLERQEAVYDRIFTLAKEHEVDAVVIAGDIWHQKHHPPLEKDLFLKKLLQYHKSGFEIILISGNHDYLEPGLTHLRHITLQTDLQRLDNVVAADTQVKLHLSNGYIFLLMPSGAYREDDFNREVRRYVKEIEESSFYVDYKGIIVVAHFAVKKCAADVAINGGTSQFRMPDGIIIEGDLPVTYIALGDLHICQRVAPGCYYSGSPIQTRWGETPDKGVLLVDTDDPDNPTFLSIPSKRLLTYYEPPEEWPKDAFIRLITDQEPPPDLPQDALVVVRPPKSTPSPTGSGSTSDSAPPDLLEGLETRLLAKGCPEEYITHAMDEARTIAREQGVTLPEDP